MATRTWLGKATAVAQVTTVQITAYDAATTYILTVGGETVSTDGDTDVNTTATNLAQAWNDATHPYFSGVTASADTDTVTLTSDTVGAPFVVTSSVSGGTGTIGAASDDTASAGPHHWDTADNWEEGAVPANGDNVILRNSSVSILFGLAQSSVTLGSLTIHQSYTGMLGLDSARFLSGTSSYSATYDEYRETHLEIGATALTIGQKSDVHSPAVGSQRVNIDLGSAESAISIHSSGYTAADSSVNAPIHLLGTHASNTAVIDGTARVHIGWDESPSSATITSLYVDDSAQVWAHGAGVSITTINVTNGYLYTSDPTTLTVTGGLVHTDSGDISTLTITGGAVTRTSSGTVGTVTMRSGTLYYDGTGTVTSLNLYGDSVCDYTRTAQARTITTLTMLDSATIKYNPSRVTLTNDISITAQNKDVQVTVADTT